MYQINLYIFAHSLEDLNHTEGVLDQFVYPALNKKNIIYHHQIYDISEFS